MEVVSQEVKSRFLRLQMNSLIGVWIGYAAYYLVRSNFNLALPYLSGELDLSKTQLGLLSSCLLITYGLSKGFMSVLADKANPKYFMAIGLTFMRHLKCIDGIHHTLFLIYRTRYFIRFIPRDGCRTVNYYGRLLVP